VENLSAFLPVVVGLVLLWVVFKVIKGVIRLGLTVVIIAVVAYFVLNVIR
jgi:hypothetical protein